MPLVQNFERPLMKETDYTKVGNGVFLNPYSGGKYTHPYYKHNKHKSHDGDGFADIFSSVGNFLKNNIGNIADAASAATSIANVIKTAKEIKKGDEELYELKRIKGEVSQKSPHNLQNKARKFTKAELEIMDKIRKGEGIKI